MGTSKNFGYQFRILVRQTVRRYACVFEEERKERGFIQINLNSIFCTYETSGNKNVLAAIKSIGVHTR